MELSNKEREELQNGEVVEKDGFYIFDPKVNVWQTMNREQLGCDDNLNEDEKPMTDKEFKERIVIANDTWADSASNLARDCF